MEKKVYILLLITSIVLNAFLLNAYLSEKHTIVDKKKQENSLNYLSPRAYNYPNDLLLNFLPLRTSLREKLAEYGDTFALYFEYLPTGTSININAQEEFHAVSLLKVPVVMAYYRQKERTGENDRMVTIKEDQLDQSFGELWKKGAGQSISLDEAARLALTASDNTALRILTDNIDVVDFEYVYEGLDIDLKEKEGGIVLSAKQYSSILKALHFSALLSKEHSEKILSHLSRTDFNEMLPAGVPNDIEIAHKIGILRDDLYLDCGIVYIPNRPYLVCMMSESTEEDAKKRMKAVSQEIYTYIYSQRLSSRR